MQATSGNNTKYENANIRNIGQGEAQYRKHKRLKLGGAQGP
jgi:hypothetical protein